MKSDKPFFTLNGRKRIADERGMILVTVILLMMIVTLLGVIAINTSSVDIQISGYLRRAATFFSGAEAGTDLAVPVIESTLAAGALDPTSIPGGSINNDGDLALEITGGKDNDADGPADGDLVLDDLNGVKVQADIDRMYSYALPGGAMEFASGYEGVGAAAAGGGIGVLYRITSEGTQ